METVTRLPSNRPKKYIISAGWTQPSTGTVGFVSLELEMPTVTSVELAGIATANIRKAIVKDMGFDHDSVVLTSLVVWN